ncbi:MAG: hypothetical protein EOM49_10870, partial [Epsilonproteobacteria bacterium]|nr:hypothetical protein [Campylobacterota bacterium]
QILLDIFEGWSYYRQYLEKYPLLKGNQINTWNGRWISHRYLPQRRLLALICSLRLRKHQASMTMQILRRMRLTST